VRSCARGGGRRGEGGQEQQIGVVLSVTPPISLPPEYQHVHLPCLRFDGLPRDRQDRENQSASRRANPGRSARHAGRCVNIALRTWWCGARWPRALSGWGRKCDANASYAREGRTVPLLGVVTCYGQDERASASECGQVDERSA